jgi:hypothetical protein
MFKFLRVNLQGELTEVKIGVSYTAELLSLEISERDLTDVTSFET